MHSDIIVLICIFPNDLQCWKSCNCIFASHIYSGCNISCHFTQFYFGANHLLLVVYYYYFLRLFDLFERETERKRKNLHSLGHYPNCHKGWDWARLNPGAVPCHQVQVCPLSGTRHLSHLLLLSQVMGREHSIQQSDPLVARGEEA